MNQHKRDLIDYRLERADALLQTARNMIQDEDWFSAVNRMYYAIYQAVAALMVRESIQIKSHSGAKAMFDKHIVKVGRAEVKWSKLYTRLADARHASDYGAFVTFTSEDVLPLLPQTEEFIAVIKQLIDTD